MVNTENLTQEELAARAQRFAKLMAKQEEIVKAQSLLKFKQAQIDNPIKPKPRKKRKKRRKK